ncbi:MAG TPA: hypothetical protein VH374_00235 [Polyangia bacterium]|nr:hypothetical protein [Polyangia bacterium]
MSTRVDRAAPSLGDDASTAGFTEASTGAVSGVVPLPASTGTEFPPLPDGEVSTAGGAPPSGMDPDVPPLPPLGAPESIGTVPGAGVEELHAPPTHAARIQKA